MGVELHLGDCLEVMPSIPDNSVDAIIADLPYGTTACKWDTVIPFEQLWKQYKRIIKPRGAVVLFGSQPFTSALVMSNVGWFKYCWVWEQDRGPNFLTAKQQPLKVHQDIAVFSQAAASYTTSGWMNYHPQKTKGKPYISHRHKDGLYPFHSSPSGRIITNKGDRYPRSVQRFNAESSLHPTQKPVALLEYLIRTYTNEGETVLDNTMGSGTTGVACVQTGRSFIGIELDPSYFAIAQRRITAVQNEMQQLALETIESLAMPEQGVLI